MSFFRNRTVIGILCIVFALVIAFVVSPLINKGLAEKTEIVVVTKDVKTGEEITADMVKLSPVGSYNLPPQAIKTTDEVVGRYATTDLFVGDYMLLPKVSVNPAVENNYLYSLNGEMQAMSVTVKTFSTGLSGKLIAGDIVSVIAPDYKKMGITLVPPELQYIEVIAVTGSSGNDANTGEPVEDKDEKELPSTVTLLVAPEQANVLAELEADGKLHITLVYRGDMDTAGNFTQAQAEVILELYPPEEDEESEEASESSGEVTSEPADSEETQTESSPESSTESAGETPLEEPSGGKD